MFFRRSYLSLATLLLAAVSVSAQTQKTPTGWAEWETISPEGEEFTVTMPKAPSKEVEKFPYHKMELNTRLYLSSLPGGPVVAIASFSGIKSVPGANSDFARFNSYIDAFKDFFPPKVRPQGTTPPKLTPLNSKPFHGHPGRAFKMTLGDLNGTLNAYVTRKRFYAIVALNTKKDDALEEKFLSSFSLPDRQPDQPKNTAANDAEQQLNPNQPAMEETAAQTSDNPAKPGARNSGGTSSVPVAIEDNTEAGGASSGTATQQPANQPPPPPQTQPGNRPPINGGVLNGKAIYLPFPEVPAGQATGVVMVQVLIDEQGTVIDARAVSGPQHLLAAAVNAARLARFTPTTLMGEAVKVMGTLSYNFVRAN
jgi:Gram-negative bacterial TonB protein C-terminal